jgi:hypothetical protein
MRCLLLLCVAALAIQAEDYKGPRPPKADVLYLVHASNLISTEVQTAQQDSKKDTDTYTVPGEASSVKTPLAEPIFLFRSERIKPDDLGLFKFDVKGGKRQLTLSLKRRKGGDLHLSITKLDKDLYRVEADDVLPNGQYSVSPSGSNTVFCFEVY